MKKKVEAKTYINISRNGEQEKQFEVDTTLPWETVRNHDTGETLLRFHAKGGEHHEYVLGTGTTWTLGYRPGNV